MNFPLLENKRINDLNRKFVALAIGALSVVAIGSFTACATSGSGLFSSSSQIASILRPTHEETLPNGLQLVLIPDQSLPSLSFGLMIKSGASDDPAGMAGLSNLVAGLLDQGTQKRSAIQIADELGRMGASFQSSVDSDYTYLSLSGLSTKSSEILSNFYEIATSPSFVDAEIARSKKQIIAGIARSFDNPGTVAGLGAEKAFFGKHPYGQPIGGTAKEVVKIRKKNIIQHYLRYYRPNDSILVVVGQYDDQFVKNVKQTFANWSAREVPKSSLAELESPKGIRILVIDKPGLTQAQIRFMTKGIRRNDSRFLPLRVGNTVFGGAFASRLNDRIRKELGLTYSIYSNFDTRLSVGPFRISTFTKTESISTVVDETIRIYQKFIRDGIDSEEMARVKGYLAGVFPQTIETSERLAFNMILLKLYGISEDYLKNYITDLNRVSLGEVNRSLKEVLSPNDLTIVIHAPAAATISLKGKYDSYDVVPVSWLK